MPANVTLEELRLRVRELADMATSAAEIARATNPELDRTINRGLKRLYDKLIIANGVDFYAKEASFSTADSVKTYPLPSDFYRLLLVSATDGGGTWRELRRWGYGDLTTLKTLEGQSASGFHAYRYRLIGGLSTGANRALEIRPQPTTAADTIGINYVPSFAPLELDTDSFDGVNGWEDWACYTAAISLLVQEDNNEMAQARAGERAEIDRQIDILASELDAHEPHVVQDLRKDWAGLRRSRCR